MIRGWGSRTSAADNGAMDVHALIAARLDLRFSVMAEAFAARVTELAGAAGLSIADFAQRVSLEDLYLATACTAGDTRAWAECEAKHFAFIRAFARRFLPDVDARDLADQVIADLWQRGKIARYAGRSTLRTWLGAVVAHAAANVRRAAAPQVPLTRTSSGPAVTAVAPSGAASPEDATAERMLAGLVSRAVAALPAEEKLMLRLYYEQGLTLDQMTRITRSSKATLSRRLKAIRSRLKSAVDDLAMRTTGTSAASIREGLRLEHLELDLSTLLRPADSVERQRPDRV